MLDDGIKIARGMKHRLEKWEPENKISCPLWQIPLTYKTDVM